MIGRILDRKYRLVRVMGEGGMGAVWEGEQYGINRRVAIKIIKAEYASKPDLIKRFYREAQAVGRVNTPHVVQVHDSGQDPETGSPYLVMEFLVGEDLSALIERLGFIRPELALRIAAQALIGLQAAHDAGVVHRDIKPANLFLSRQPGGNIIVKVLDFGIAKTAAAPEMVVKGTKLTRTGSPIGSPAYMSPEQAAEIKSIDHRTDLWSMGAVLYECLTQRTPYSHVESLIQLFRAVTEGPPRPIQDHAPWVPREVAAIVHGAMCDRSDRFPTAAAMLDAMLRLLPQGYAVREEMLTMMAPEARSSISARLSVGASKFSTAQAGTNSGLSTTTEGQARPRSVLPVAIASGVLVAISIPVLYWHLTHPKPPPETAKVADAAPPAPASVPVAEPRKLSARVRIVPPDASVEVDGVKAATKDGAIEITGAAGSVHKVKLWSGEREMVVDVGLTEAGALPPSVELPAAPVAPPSAAPQAPAVAPKPAKSKPATPHHPSQF